MEGGTVGRVMARAALDEEFRARFLDNLGMALAQDGFLLTDGEMRQLRDWWDEIRTMGARDAAERIRALARSYRS
ncbi:MAG TPA: hypothetical protein VKU84_08980 [Stellaceae bacterium]|nr:hypothetical protein [Stellaceae bacterium]